MLPLDQLSNRLARATDDEARARAWSNYLVEHRDAFEQDAEVARDLLQDGNLNALAALASQSATARAIAAAQAAHDAQFDGAC